MSGADGGRAAGTLHLVATPIGNLGDLSSRAGAILAEVDVVACEDTRRTGRLFAHLGVPRPPMVVVNEHTEDRVVADLVARLRDGASVALVSDAGTPTVSDPGYRLVRAAVAAGVPVTAVPGPSATLAALAVSGLPTDRFCVEGFLPRRGRARRVRLDELATEPRTSVLFESPHRLAATLAELAEVLGPSRRAVVARELTKLHEEVWRGSLDELARRAAGAPVRGEVVVVLAGAPEPDGPADDVVRDALRRRLAAGDSRRAAVVAVSDALGVGRNRVYGLALTLDNS